MEKEVSRLSISTGTFVRFFLVMVAMLALYQVRDIILMVLAAIVIAAAVEPPTQWFVKKGFPRLASVLVIYLSALILVFGFFYLMLPLVISQSTDLIQKLPAYIDDFNTSTSTTGIWSVLPKEAISASDLLQRLQAGASEASSSIFGFVTALFGGVASALIVFVMSLYLAIMDDGVSHLLKVVIPPSYVDRTIDLWIRSRLKMGRWLQGQLLLCLFVGILSYIGLSILGVPNALVLAMLAGLLEIIPMFGPIISSIPAIIIGAAAGGVQMALFVAALFFIVQQLENHVLVPLVLKKVLGLPSIIVILSLLIGAKLAGFIGMLIAVPLSAVIMEMYKDLSDRRTGKSEDENHDTTFHKIADRS